jgi:hypothetical protein
MHGVVPSRKSDLARRRKASVMSEEEQNKALVSHFLQELAKGNVEVTGELLSPVRTSGAR